MNKAKSAAEFAKKQLNQFFEPFKSLDRKIFYIVLCRIAFYAFSIVSAIILRNILLKKGEGLMNIDNSLLAAGPSPELSAVSSAIKSFYYQAFAYSIIIAIAIFAAYLITNFIIWSLISGRDPRKAGKKFTRKFLIMAGLWAAGWILASSIIISSMRQETILKASLALLLIYSHFTAVLYTSYFKNGKAAKAFRKAFDAGFTKIHYFIIPYAFAGIIFFLLNKIFLPLNRIDYISLNANASTALFLAIFLFYAAWLRIYIYSFAKNLV